MLATFAVTNLLDAGPGSLRQAILDANATAGADTIAFDVNGGLPVSTTQQISPASELPVIADPVVIDATTQPGYSGAPLIRLHGGSAGSGARGLPVQAGSSTVRGLIISSFKGSGIELSGSGGNIIQGNYIGTSASGGSASANYAGISIIGCGGNTIGGDAFVSGGRSYSARNVISGNTSDGIYVEGASNNVIRGNHIGTNPAGTSAVRNGGNGIWLANGASQNTIGGTAAAHRNVISGNSQSGIHIWGSNASYNVVQGNYIGLNAAGTGKIANEQHGVNIDGEQLSGVRGNLVGGTVAGAANAISGNARSGLQIAGAGASENLVQGNLIGTNAAGAAAVGNGDNGINISYSTYNTIGGTPAAARNILSGNKRNGMELQDDANFNVVQGNYMGLNLAGTAALPNEDDGLDINSSSYNTIGGTEPGAANIVSGNLSDGLEIAADAGRYVSDAHHNLIQGNRIGTNPAGTAAIPNASNGIRIVNQLDPAGVWPPLSARQNTIGGSTATARNIISGNGSNGIHLVGAFVLDNLIQGNLIGTDHTGLFEIGNSGSGIAISGGSNNVIGGAGAGEGNLIADNSSAGIAIIGTPSATPPAPASGNRIQGNLIGLAADGTMAMPNRIAGVSITDASDNLVGGTEPGAGNTIAYNGAGTSTSPGGGVLVQSVAAPASGNAIRGNSIFSNTGPATALGVPTGLAIDLGEPGVTANDAGDLDAGANGLQNFPVIASASVTNEATRIQGTLNSQPDSTFTLEFFASPAADPTGYGEGRTFLGSIQVMTDAEGIATFDLSRPLDLTGSAIAATATSTEGSTSEFSAAVTAGGAVLTIQGDSAGPGADDIRLARDPANPDRLNVFINSPDVPSYWAHFPSLRQVIIRGLEGDDRLIIDHSAGPVIPPEGIDYDGGAGADELVLRGADALEAFTLGAGAVASGGAAVAYAGTEAMTLGTGAFRIEADLAGLALTVHGSAAIQAAQRLSRLALAAGSAVRLEASGITLTAGTFAMARADGDWAASLDLGTGAMSVTDALDVPQLLDDMHAMIASARNAAVRWHGNGITSSAAGGPMGLALVLDASNDVLVRLTYNGDLDADGDVDGDDYFVADQAFLKSTVPARYQDGDASYDGRVDGDDYFLMDMAYIEQLAAPAVSTPVAPTPSLFSAAPVASPDVFDDSPAQRRWPI